MLVLAPLSLSWSHYYFYNSIMMCFTSIVILSVVSHTITTFAIPIPSEPDAGLVFSHHSAQLRCY